jgi:DNA (cytosine-5)-methyltransferase 1
MKIVHVDLFSGIGGFAKAFIDAGYEIEHHFFSEIDLHAIANYKNNFPNAEYIGSVTDVSGTAIRKRFPNSKIVVTFGFPCQDNSIAGKRKGTVRGTRSGLLFESGRICLESKCEIFIAENVKGLYSVNGGEDFQEALRFLTFLDTDSPQYTVEVQLLNTSWILPQNRERVYFVGHIGTRSVRRIFPVTENDFRTTEGASDPATVRTITGGGAFRRDAQQYDLTPCVNDRGLIRENEISTCIDANYHKGIDSHGARTMIKYDSNTNTTNTLTGVTKDNMLMEGYKIRRLTEIECERLQGFPDSWTKYGMFDGVVKEISRTQRYKMCGNAVTKDIVELIVRKLLN